MRLILISIILVLLVTNPILSEVIYLNNGNVVNGKILEDTETKITVMTDAGKLTLPKNIVSKIEKSIDSSNLKLDAEICVAQKDIPTAITKYDEYIKQAPEDVVAKQRRSELVTNLFANLCIKAENLFNSNEFEKAIAEYENVLVSQSSPIIKELINQKLSIAHTKLAHKQFDIIKLNEAKDSCQKAISYDNNNIDAKKLLIKIHLDENNSQLALPLLVELISIAPDDELKLALAECYYESEEDEKACPLLESIKGSSKIDNTVVKDMLKEIYYNRYSSYSEKGKHKEALDEYLKYFDYSLKDSELYEECANAYKNAGMMDKSDELMKLAAEAKLKETNTRDSKQKIIIHSTSDDKADSNYSSVQYSKTKRKGKTASRSSSPGASGKGG